MSKYARFSPYYEMSRHFQAAPIGMGHGLVLLTSEGGSVLGDAKGVAPVSANTFVISPGLAIDGVLLLGLGKCAHLSCSFPPFLA